MFLTTYNFSDNYATLNSDVKKILNEYVARYTAICGIAYNMAGFTTRIEAEDMINYHDHRIQKIEELLTNKSIMDFFKVA